MKEGKEEVILTDVVSGSLEDLNIKGVELEKVDGSGPEGEFNVDVFSPVETLVETSLAVRGYVIIGRAANGLGFSYEEGAYELLDDDPKAYVSDLTPECLFVVVSPSVYTDKGLKDDATFKTALRLAWKRAKDILNVYSTSIDLLNEVSSHR